MNKRYVLAATLILCLLATAVVVERSRMSGAPRTILWAWERPEDLRFLDPRQVGVAYLAATLDLPDGRVLVRPRFQPLRVPDSVSCSARISLGDHPYLEENSVRVGLAEEAERYSWARCLAGEASRGAAAAQGGRPTDARRTVSKCRNSSGQASGLSYGLPARRSYM